MVVPERQHHQHLVVRVVVLAVKLAIQITPEEQAPKQIREVLGMAMPEGAVVVVRTMKPQVAEVQEQ